MATQPKRLQELEAAIDGVAASYTGSLEIDNLESAALPNKRAVIEATDHVKHALFMGFYSTRALTRGNLRDSLRDHMKSAYTMLIEQIERALTYDQWMGRTD